MTARFVGFYLDGWSAMAGSCPALLLAMLFSCALALALHRVSSVASPPPLALGGPLALAGFVIAATWIDTIANEVS